MTDYSIFSGAGSASLSGPGASVSFASPITVGSQFKVTSSGLYLKGYQYWVADAGGNHGPQKFALWQPNPDSTTWSLIAAGTVTSGSFANGQWNQVLLAAPVPLTPGVTYLAATGYTGNFNETKNFWGTAGTGVNGLVNGPLTFYSDIAGNGGALPPDFGHVQSAFSTAGADPAVSVPGSADSSFNCWIDVIVTDVAPAGATYRAFPNFPEPTSAESTDVTGYALGMEFSLTQACTLTRIWHYSPPGAVVLPTRCLIWNVGGQSVVAGSDNASPSWSGSAGSGWVSCDYTSSGVTLAANTNYKVSTYHGPGAGQFWFGVTTHYWDTGPGGSGLTYGPLTVPNNATASPGQSSWNAGSFGYPNTSASPENDWVDVEVTPAPASLLAVPPLMPPGLSSPAAWQRPRYRRAAAAAAITGSGGVVLPKPSLSGSGLLTVTGSGGVVLPKPSLSLSGSVAAASGIARPPLMPPGLASPAAWQRPRYRRLPLTATSSGITGSGGVTLPKPSLAAASPPPVTAAPAQGGWWQLHGIITAAAQEREFWDSQPAMACPRCGEPLRPAPPSDSGSAVESYCQFDGFRYPGDWDASTMSGY